MRATQQSGSLARRTVVLVGLSLAVGLAGCSSAKSWVFSSDKEAAWQREPQPVAPPACPAPPAIQQVSATSCPTCAQAEAPAKMEPAKEPPLIAGHQRTFFDALRAYWCCLHSPPP